MGALAGLGGLWRRSSSTQIALERSYRGNARGKEKKDRLDVPKQLDEGLRVKYVEQERARRLMYFTEEDLRKKDERKALRKILKTPLDRWRYDLANGVPVSEDQRVWNERRAKEMFQVIHPVTVHTCSRFVFLPRSAAEQIEV